MNPTSERFLTIAREYTRDCQWVIRALMVVCVSSALIKAGVGTAADAAAE